MSTKTTTTARPDMVVALACEAVKLRDAGLSAPEIHAALCRKFRLPPPRGAVGPAAATRPAGRLH